MEEVPAHDLVHNNGLRGGRGRREGREGERERRKGQGLEGRKGDTADEAWYGLKQACALGGCSHSRSKNHSRPMELWFSINSCRKRKHGLVRRNYIW